MAAAASIASCACTSATSCPCSIRAGRPPFQQHDDGKGRETMTRLLMSGWETGDVNQIGASLVGTNGTIAVATATPTPRSGSYCLKITHTNSDFPGGGA